MGVKVMSDALVAHLRISSHFHTMRLDSVSQREVALHIVGSDLEKMFIEIEC